MLFWRATNMSIPRRWQGYHANVFMGLIIFLVILIFKRYKNGNERPYIQRDNNHLEKMTDFQEENNIFGDVETFIENNNICRKIRRPREKDINLRNNFWHYFKNGNISVFLFGAYLDDREFVQSPGGRVIRLFPMMTTPLGQEEAMQCDTYHLLLWYDDVTNPVPTSCRCLSFSSIPWWTIQNERYGHVVLECDIPTGDILPSYISLVYDMCDIPYTYVPLTIPEKPVPKPKTFGVCVKAIFGIWTKENVTYIFSWLETLKAFGMTHVHMYHDALHLDKLSTKGFEYYIKNGFLTFERLPSNLYETDTPYVDAPISQSVVKTVVNDCFYRNLHKFSYLAHIDLDEILIPHSHESYAELFTDYFKNDILDINTTHVVARSAYFYTYYPPGNPDAPDYIPLLKQTYRTPIEYPTGPWYTWATRGTGVQKAIDSTKSCIVMSIHACAKGAREYYINAESTKMTPDLLLSHHYRTRCQNHNRCRHEVGRRVNDLTIPNKVGSQVYNNITLVLKAIGYFSNSTHPNT